MATAFETALTDAGDTVVGYANTALPVVGLVAAAFLAVKYVRKIIGRL